jgi:hypothetical protein
VEIFDYVISAHGVVVFYLFENYYVHEVLDYSSVEGICCFGFQCENRFESIICFRI